MIARELMKSKNHLTAVTQRAQGLGREKRSALRSRRVRSTGNTFAGRAICVLCVSAVSLFLLCQLVAAQTDQIIYSDALSNGWQDWSWSARDLNSTDFVHGGAKSIKVTYTAAWQGFYLHHTAFDTSEFVELTFWVHGGAVNGRNITVAALLADAPQPSVALNTYIASGSVAAGVWRKVTIPLAALQVANRSNMTGFWLQDASGSSQPAFYLDDISLVARPAPSQVLINVYSNNVRRTVDPRMFGVSSAIWDAAFNTPATISLLGANNTRVLRFPGGSRSDEYHWETNRTDDGIFWATDFADFANVATSINAQAFITVNYGSGTPQEAADWVRHSNITRGYGFKYWEIGNENYGSWENDTHPRPHDPFTYGVLARDYINQMKAVDPTIKVGVVVNTGEDSYANYTDHPATNPRTGQAHNGWTPVMLTTLSTMGVTPDFVIYHRYEQAPGSESDSVLLQSASGWETDAADLRQQLTDYLGPQGASVEIVCTENNSVFSNPGKQTTSLVNGLFYADSVGQILQTEFKALVWWIMRNAQESGNNNNPSLYGWRQYGDYGMVSEQSNPYPTYYASKLVSRFASGGDQVVEAASDYSLLSAYAVRRADGRISLLVINKSRTASLNASITLAGYTPQAVATVYSYGVPQDEAARTGVGSPDIAEGSFSGASASFAYTFAPYSATVIRLSHAACGSVAPTEHLFLRSGGAGSVTVTAPGSCSWTAASNAAWVVITSAGSGAGNETVTFEVRENQTASSQSTTLTVAGQTITVLQEGSGGQACSYSIAPISSTVNASGGSGSITVTTAQGCAWQARSNVNWITLASPVMGVGNGLVNYSVAANPETRGRKGTITIAGKSFTVKQR